MKNKFRNLNEKAKFHLDQLMQEIHHVAYNEGYEAGKLVGAIDSVEGINDKWLAERKPKSANQQRAELIDKAKKFMEGKKVKRYIKGDELKVYINRKTLNWLDADFVVNAEKRTVVCLIRWTKDKSLEGRGIAKCNPSDVFNEHIGKVIALGRALKIDIPVEFSEAVQPDEFVEGQVIHYQYDGVDEYQSLTRIDEINKRAYFNGKYKESFHHMYRVNEEGYTITNDTNAKYEVTS